MAEGDNRSTNVLAAETACLEEQLQRWREVMLMADKVLQWESSELGLSLRGWRKGKEASEAGVEGQPGRGEGDEV